MRQEKKIRKRRMTKAERRRRRRIRRIVRAVGVLIIFILALMFVLMVWKLFSGSVEYREKLTALPEPVGSETISEEETIQVSKIVSDLDPMPQATAVPVDEPKEESDENTGMPMVEDPDEIIPTTAVYVAASMNHSAWIRDGRVYVAGSEYYDESDVSEWDSVLQISLSDGHIAAVDEKGNALAAGLNGSGQCNMNGLSGVAYVATGLEYTVCVMRDGTLRLFGAVDAQIRSGMEACQGALLADVSATHAVVLHTDGTVSAFGAGTYGECDVENWRNIQSVSAGDGFTVALTQNGEVLFCGNNDYGQKNAAQWMEVAAVEAGHSYIVAIRKNGTMYTIGRNGQGQCELDDWQDVAAVAAGYDHTIGLMQNGTILAAGYDGDGQCDIH